MLPVHVHDGREFVATCISVILEESTCQEILGIYLLYLSHSHRGPCPSANVPCQSRLRAAGREHFTKCCWQNASGKNLDDLREASNFICEHRAPAPKSYGDRPMADYRGVQDNSLHSL